MHKGPILHPYDSLTSYYKGGNLSEILLYSPDFAPIHRDKNRTFEIAIISKATCTSHTQLSSAQRICMVLNGSTNAPGTEAVSAVYIYVHVK